MKIFLVVILFLAGLALAEKNNEKEGNEIITIVGLFIIIIAIGLILSLF